MDTVTVLNDARALIAKPENWCQRRFYKPLPSGGVAQCAEGALITAAGARGHYEAMDALERCIPVSACETADNLRPSVAAFNDRSSTTHADILALFDRAIQRAVKSKAGA